MTGGVSCKMPTTPLLGDKAKATEGCLAWSFASIVAEHGGWGARVLTCAGMPAGNSSLLSYPHAGSPPDPVLTGAIDAIVRLRGRQKRERGKPDPSPLSRDIGSAAGDPRGKLLRERVRERGESEWHAVMVCIGVQTLPRPERAQTSARCGCRGPLFEV